MGEIGESNSDFLFNRVSAIFLQDDLSDKCLAFVVYLVKTYDCHSMVIGFKPPSGHMEDSQISGQIPETYCNFLFLKILAKSQKLVISAKFPNFLANHRNLGKHPLFACIFQTFRNPNFLIRANWFSLTCL